MSPYSLFVSTGSKVDSEKSQGLATWNSALHDQTKCLSCPQSNIPMGRLLLQPNKRVSSYFQNPECFLLFPELQLPMLWEALALRSSLTGPAVCRVALDPQATFPHMHKAAQQHTQVYPLAAAIARPGQLLAKPCTPVDAIQTASTAQGCPSVSPKMATKLHHTSSSPIQLQVAHKGLVCDSALRCIKHL